MTIMIRVLFLAAALVYCNPIYAMQKPKVHNPLSLKDLCAKVILKNHTDLDLLNCNNDIKEFLRAKQALMVNDLLLRYKEPQEALLNAITRHCNCAILPLIKLGAKINPEQPEQLHETPLITAIQTGNFPACKQLLLLGADPNKAAGDYAYRRITPLSHAVDGSSWEGSFESEMRIINLLLDSGTQMNKANSWDGAPALFWAFKRKHWKTIVRCLLVRGAHINITDNDGQTPLMLAMRLRKGKAARYLISRGALIDPIDNYGQNAFMYACAFGARSKVIRKLLDINSAQIKMQDKKGNTALHLAVAGHRVKAVKLLLLHGASIDIKNADGETPLDIAKRRGLKHATIILGKYTAK